MIRTMILLMIIGLLTIIGTLLNQQSGYIKIILENGTLEMKLWYFLLALVIIITVSIIFIKILWLLIRIPKTLAKFGKNRRQYIVSELLQKGMLAMGKGQWKKAEKLLFKGAKVTRKNNGDPSLFLTIAAQAAHKQGHEKRRNKYLLEARQLSAEGIDTLTSTISEARLYLDANKPQKALNAIKLQKKSHEQNLQLLSIESEAYEKQENYQKVWDLLPCFKKQFTDKESYQKRQVYLAKKLFIDPSISLDDIEIIWKNLDKNQRKDDGVFLNYISGLIHHEQKEKAEKLLSKNINTNFSDPVIHAYTQLEISSNADKRFKKIVYWLNHKPENSYLNYGAAKLAFQLEKFRTARDYAITSIKYQALPEALFLLGKIYENLGESSNALHAYRGSVGLIYNDEQIAAVDNKLLLEQKTNISEESNEK